MTGERKRKGRRHAVRLSDAVDYDRTADRPSVWERDGRDPDRVVPLDDAEGVADAYDGAGFDGDYGKDRAFYEEEKPPHY